MFVKSPGFLTSGKPLRLMHMQRRCTTTERCDGCDKPLRSLTAFWRVRSRVKREHAPPDIDVSAFTSEQIECVYDFCGETCARETFDALVISMALVTGKVPTRVAYSKTVSKKAKGTR